MNPFERLKLRMLEFDRRASLYGENYESDRAARLYEEATARLERGERRVAAFEGTIGPRLNWLTSDLFDVFEAPRLFALTDRRLFALRIGRFSDKVIGLHFSDARHSVRLVSHKPPSGLSWGRLKIRRSTGNVIGVNYAQPWREQVEVATSWLVK